MSLEAPIGHVTELQIRDARRVISVRYHIHPPHAVEIEPGRSYGAGVECGVITQCHLAETVPARHREGESPLPIREIAKINAPDQEFLVNHFDYVVKTLPGEVHITKQDVTAGFQRSMAAMADRDFLQAVPGFNAIIRIARDACVFSILLRELLLKSGKDCGGHGVQYVTLR